MRKRYGKRKLLSKTDKSGLSTKEAKAVKQIILAKAPKSRAHNGPSAGPAITGLVPTLPTPIISFSNINAGQAEYQRRGDQIFIDKISFKGYLWANSTHDAVRFTVLRQPRSGFPTPSTITPAQVWQNFSPAAVSVVSQFQDDQPADILYDQVFTIGTAAGMQ